MTRLEEIGIKEKRVRALMDKHDLRGILLKTQANFSWFTGGGINEVTISDILGVTAVLITNTERIIITNNIEAARMIEDEGLSDLEFTIIQYEWHESDEVKELIKIIDPDTIGCDAVGFSYTCLAKEIKELRYSLLPIEIDRYLWLGYKASLAVETILSMVKKGMRECMVTGEVLRMLWYDRIDSICNQSAADERTYKYRHPIATEKNIDKYLLFNVNARKWGLVTTITRSVYLGKLPVDLEKQYTDNLSIECGMISATKINTSMSTLFQHTKDLYKNHGYGDEWMLHHQGGAQGYNNRDYLAYPDSDTEMVCENQCFCWNPSIAGKDYGTKTEDAFIVTKDETLMITNPVFFPKKEISINGINFIRPGILEL